MEYGSKRIKKEKIYLYQGFDPASKNFPVNEAHLNTRMDAINQRDADLLFLWQRVRLLSVNLTNLFLYANVGIVELCN